MWIFKIEVITCLKKIEKSHILSRKIIRNLAILIIITTQKWFIEIVECRKKLSTTIALKCKLIIFFFSTEIWVVIVHADHGPAKLRFFRVSRTIRNWVVSGRLQNPIPEIIWEFWRSEINELRRESGFGGAKLMSYDRIPETNQNSVLFWLFWLYRKPETNRNYSGFVIGRVITPIIQTFWTSKNSRKHRKSRKVWVVITICRALVQMCY